MSILPRNVIVVDDEPSKRLALETRLQSSKIAVRSYETAESALEGIRLEPPDALVTDLCLPGKDGLWLLEQVMHGYPAVDVIVMTAYGSIETAVQAMRAGAFDYLTKPFPGQELLIRLERLATHQRERREVESLRAKVAELTAMDELVGVSDVFRGVVAQARTVAPTEAPVLLIGETGTGKERLARAIHASSARRDGPFVALSCAALSPTLIESELFGHEEGAFSGAHKTRRGRFELAHGGTLLLDDVDDIPVDLQAKLLRVLQERTIERVGGERELPVDFRLVAATKSPLEQLVAEGRFREDLMFRLSVVEIALPSLRDRPEDVGALAAHFLDRKRTPGDLPARRFGADALRVLAAYDWPGNVRQLENAVEHALTFCPCVEIAPEHLPARVRNADPDTTTPLSGLEGCDEIDFQKTVDAVERQLLGWALDRSGGSQSAAARLLGLPRTTLQDRAAAPRPRMSTSLRFPWRVLAMCVGLILTLFAVWELIELTWFSGADPAVLHVLYLARGILGSVFTASLAAWILYRGHRRGLELAAAHETRMVEAARLAVTGQLAAGLAHEIGNPLSGAMECVRLVREGEAGAARSDELLDTAEQALARIDRSIGRFLDLSRASALEPVEVSIAPLLDQAARLVEPTLARRQVALVVEASAPGLRQRADPDALVQVLVNLLLNAGAACEPGGRVRLSARETSEDLSIEVSDDGVGVDPDLGDVTQPFVTGRPAGVGLGLAVSRRIAEAHGGTLRHRPRAPRGTVFEMRLPR